MLTIQKIPILFFIGNLHAGGKERRLIELLSYLNCTGRYELMVVVTDLEVHYPAFNDLDLTFRIIQKKWKRKDLVVFYQFYKICKQFKPRLIHTWGRIQSFYALPAVTGLGIPLVNGQITSAPPNEARWSFKRIMDRINFNFSTIIISNSLAGIDAYRPPAKKIKMIYNGINFGRLENLPAPELVKSKYGITTPYAVVMVARFSITKDYHLFFSIAQKMAGMRDDITFIAVGDYVDIPEFERFCELANGNSRIIITGRITDVEAVVNSCTIGILFSNTTVNGEGISNAIIEYMSLGRPVIANDSGATKEIVHHNVNGYLVTHQTENEIIGLITDLVDHPEKCTAFGNAGRRKIEESFSLDKMGKAYEQTYQKILGCSDLEIL